MPSEEANFADRVQSIHNGLDLGFSDYYSDQNVRDNTIRNHLEEIEDAQAMLGVEEAINYSLFNSLGQNHPSPNIYILNFPSDLRASFYTMLGGYYRQGILLLRNWLEMRIFGIYFGKIEKDPTKYQGWKAGTSDEVFGGRLIRRLFANADFRRADERLGLRSRLETLYSDLSTFTHGAGLEKYDLAKDTDNVPRYNRGSVQMWITLFHRTFAEVTFWNFLAYGINAISAVGPEEIKTLRAHLPDEYNREMDVLLGR